MGEWWTYRPSDFLLFSARVYERLIESHNAAIWPAQALAAALGLCVLVLALRGGAKAGRAALAIAGAGLAVSGWSFLWTRYAGINWAAGYFAPGFCVAGAVFMATAALLREPLRPRGRTVRPAVALVALAVAYPVIAPAFGRGWGSAEVAGLMPDPSALMALGLAAFVTRRLAAVIFALVPLAWSLYAAMTLFTLGAPQAWAITFGLALFAASVAYRLFDRSPGERAG